MLSHPGATNVTDSHGDRNDLSTCGKRKSSQTGSASGYPGIKAIKLTLDLETYTLLRKLLLPFHRETSSEQPLRNACSFFFFFLHASVIISPQSQRVFGPSRQRSRCADFFFVVGRTMTPVISSVRLHNQRATARAKERASWSGQLPARYIPRVSLYMIYA